MALTDIIKREDTMAKALYTVKIIRENRKKDYYDFGNVA